MHYTMMTEVESRMFKSMSASFVLEQDTVQQSRVWRREWEGGRGSRSTHKVSISTQYFHEISRSSGRSKEGSDHFESLDWLDDPSMLPYRWWIIDYFVVSLYLIFIYRSACHIVSHRYDTVLLLRCYCDAAVPHSRHRQTWLFPSVGIQRRRAPPFAWHLYLKP